MYREPPQLPKIEKFDNGIPYEQIDAAQLVQGDVLLPWTGEVEVTGVWRVEAISKIPNGIAYRADQVSHRLQLDLVVYGFPMAEPLSFAKHTRTMLPTDLARVWRPEGSF